MRAFTRWRVGKKTPAQSYLNSATNTYLRIANINHHRKCQHSPYPPVSPQQTFGSIFIEVELKTLFEFKAFSELKRYIK